jgi:hypothetical protein
MIRGWLVLVMSSCLVSGCGSAEELVPRADPTGGGQTQSAVTSVQYASKVVSYTEGEKGGLNEDKLPGVVLGPPRGGGCCAGSLDVLSLGDGGEIVLEFDAPIVDGAGVDFIVFENPFQIGGDPSAVLAEPAEVSVSEDGVTWTTFPCTAKEWPYGTCAGWRPVLATLEAPLDPREPAKAGGDPFDLATVGVERARFVRIRDMNRRFPAAAPTAGFDLDAIAALHFVR